MSRGRNKDGRFYWSCKEKNKGWLERRWDEVFGEGRKGMDNGCNRYGVEEYSVGRMKDKE